MKRDAGLTTAEKRAVTPDWPDCECHTMPMLWQKRSDLAEGGRFFCRATSRTSRNRLRRKVVAAGLCGMCRAPLDTAFRCRPCADGNADHMASPVGLMKTRASQARGRARRRAAEGFRPTGFGRQLADHYLREVSRG